MRDEDEGGPKAHDILRSRERKMKMPKLKRWQVFGTAHMACIIEVEAANKQEAMDIANDCHASLWELITSDVQGPIEAEIADEIKD